jgi:hypothetical protein
MKNKKHNVWGGILSFFISALHFWIKHYSNFLNLTKFVLQQLIATHGHFHRHQFFTANYFLYGLYRVTEYEMRKFASHFVARSIYDKKY